MAGGENRANIIVAIISALGVLGAAAIANWDVIQVSVTSLVSKPLVSEDCQLDTVTVTNLRFYESSYGLPELSKRVFKNEFAKSESRYINWHLDLQYSAHGCRVDFIIDSAYYGPNNDFLLVKQTTEERVEGEWTSSYSDNGWGWNEPGNWKEGEYTVRISIDGHNIATASFLVY